MGGTIPLQYSIAIPQFILSSDNLLDLLSCSSITNLLLQALTYLLSSAAAATSTAATTTTTVLWPSGFCLGLPKSAGTKKVKPGGKTNLDLLQQETTSGTGIKFTYIAFGYSTVKQDNKNTNRQDMT